MTNIELQYFLRAYPDDTPIKLLVNHQKRDEIYLSDENIMLTSETATINQDAPEDEWDMEDGKLELGDGERYLLFNPIIL